MSVPLGQAPTVSNRRNAFRRPEDLTDRTLWLFAGLAAISLVLCLPAVVTTSRGGLLVLGLSTMIVLILSWSYGYVFGRAPLALDVVDMVAFALLSQALPNPTIVLGAVYGAVWLRGLYGSTLRSVVRSALYALGLVAAVILWPFFHAPDNEIIPMNSLGTIPTLFLTVLIVRQLGLVLVSRDQAMQRDRELAATGSLLLGVVDAKAIRAIGWVAARNLCAATPGLRIVRAVPERPHLRIDGVAGDFLTVPETVPEDAIVMDTDLAEAQIADSSALDAAAGSPLVWSCLAANDREGSLVLVGAPTAMASGAVVSVRSLVNQVSLAMRNSSVQRKLAALATSDPLTGLDNRASFLEKLTVVLAETVSPDWLHVLFLDLDDFKNVNDVLGHRAGDELLITIASRMRAHTRPEDICARLGGDEFAIVLSGTSGAEALEIAGRLGEVIADPVQLHGQVAQVGVSIGLATATPAVPLADLVHNADVAMYAAKANGKNQVQVYVPGLLRAANHQKSLELQLAAERDADLPL